MTYTIVPSCRYDRLCEGGLVTPLLSSVWCSVRNILVQDNFMKCHDRNTHTPSVSM